MQGSITKKQYWSIGIPAALRPSKKIFPAAQNFGGTHGFGLDTGAAGWKLRRLKRSQLARFGSTRDDDSAHAPPAFTSIHATTRDSRHHSRPNTTDDAHAPTATTTAVTPAPTPPPAQATAPAPPPPPPPFFHHRRRRSHGRLYNHQAAAACPPAPAAAWGCNGRAHCGGTVIAIVSRSSSRTRSRQRSPRPASAPLPWRRQPQPQSQ